jgi:hypothetical protein
MHWGRIGTNISAGEGERRSVAFNSIRRPIEMIPNRDWTNIRAAAQTVMKL